MSVSYATQRVHLCSGLPPQDERGIKRKAYQGPVPLHLVCDYRDPEFDPPPPRARLHREHASPEERRARARRAAEIKHARRRAKESPEVEPTLAEATPLCSCGRPKSPNGTAPVADGSRRPIWQCWVCHPRPKRPRRPPKPIHPDAVPCPVCGGPTRIHGQALNGRWQCPRCKVRVTEDPKPGEIESPRSAKLRIAAKARYARERAARVTGGAPVGAEER